ncbi:hypothetical protein BD311DRAFT_863568 [Dichomitus squalens]|uniref:Uncharacterized protein n=1 Tax=Dichomitus squalens TaxID=114155 RepID=A0A4Q9MTB0_9APHY|nr:hypothetical protein BD311DRAFT_863568 [Dichomitus squalens]
MSNPDSISHVLELVSHLDRPRISSGDIAWATDIPAGKQLLQWLGAQLPDPSFADQVALAESNHTGPGCNPTLRASLAPIALYSEELDVLAALKVQDGSPPTTSGGSTPSAYELPSQLRFRTAVLEAEADLLDKQAARYKHRSSAVKAASKDTKRTIHPLRKQIQMVDDTIEGQQQRLANLSAEMDNNVARHVDSALRVMHEAVPHDVLDKYRADIALLSSSRTEATTAVKQLYRAVDDGYGSLPTVGELQDDASTIHVRLNELERDTTLFEKILQVAYAEELEKMAKRLEEAAVGSDEIVNILSSADPGSVSDEEDVPVSTLKVDVKGELERAVRMDRLALLGRQESGLDAVTDHMEKQLIPRLQDTYTDLHERSIAAVETEAIVSALIEELEDINDAVEAAKSTTSESVEDSHAILEVEMVDLLKELLGDSPGSNTVLLDRRDVVAEVSKLSARHAASKAAYEEWTSKLRGQIQELSSGTVPLLSTVYTHAPVNTSQPFAPGPALAALQADTRAKASELVEAAAKLQKDTELSSRDKKKLGLFLEKWAQK